MSTDFFHHFQGFQGFLGHFLVVFQVFLEKKLVIFKVFYLVYKGNTKAKEVQVSD